MIVVTAAAREDGYTKLVVPADLPAVADHQVVGALSEVCRERGCTYHQGLVLTSDMFYPGQLPSSLELYSKCGVLGVEMEAACLLVVAQLRRIRAGAVAVVDGNPLKWGDGDYDPHGEKVAEAKKNMLLVGLHLAVKMAVEEAEEATKKRKATD